MQIALQEHFYNPKCTELSQIGKNKTKQNTLTKDKLTTKNYKPSEGKKIHQERTVSRHKTKEISSLSMIENTTICLHYTTAVFKGIKNSLKYQQDYFFN